MNFDDVLMSFIHNKLESLNGENHKKEVKPDDSLFSLGILDSMSLLQLVSLIEEHYKITIDDADLIPDNFMSINVIKKLIANKVQSA